MRGTVEAIHVAAAAAAPMRRVSEARAVPGAGLEGDRYRAGVGYYSPRPLPGGGRELTLIEAEILDSLERETGIRLSQDESRRNVTTRGIRLDELIGRRFRIGEIRCEGVRICEPCTYLEGLTGKAVFEPLVHRGGLRANILSPGLIRVGDPVEVEAPA